MLLCSLLSRGAKLAIDCTGDVGNVVVQSWF